MQHCRYREQQLEDRFRRVVRRVSPMDANPEECQAAAGVHRCRTNATQKMRPSWTLCVTLAQYLEKGNRSIERCSSPQRSCLAQCSQVGSQFECWVPAIKVRERRRKWHMVKPHILQPFHVGINCVVFMPMWSIDLTNSTQSLRMSDVSCCVKLLIRGISVCCFLEIFALMAKVSDAHVLDTKWTRAPNVLWISVRNGI